MSFFLVKYSRKDPDRCTRSDTLLLLSRGSIGELRIERLSGLQDAIDDTNPGK